MEHFNIKHSKRIVFREESNDLANLSVCKNCCPWTPMDELGGIAAEWVLSRANGRENPASGPLTKQKSITKQ